MATENQPTCEKTTRREFFMRSAAIATALAVSSGPLSVIAADDLATEEKTLAFTAEGKQFSFDTGRLSGVLRAGGQSKGLTPVVDTASGRTISQSLGIFSHYRMLTSKARYGNAAWDWPSVSNLAADGSITTVWTADETYPFDMKAVCRWTKPDTMDMVTTITAREDLPRFEVFLASYFEGFDESWVYANVKDPVTQGGKRSFLPATLDQGKWQMFPRDKQAIEIIRDGRWKRLPHPVDWAIRPMLAGPLGMRRDRQTGLTAMVMAPPSDCFAVATPYGEQFHRSLYLSLFGRDIRAGQTATARSRLVIRRDVSFDNAIEIYKEYISEHHTD